MAGVLEFPADPSGNPLKTTGLHRAPLSAGVKNATQRYDLPSPAVAVRNLVEQANYAHLCTIMSGMHHRRAGYPFGTLVRALAAAAWPRPAGARGACAERSLHRRHVAITTCKAAPGFHSWG